MLECADLSAYFSQFGYIMSTKRYHCIYRSVSSTDRKCNIHINDWLFHFKFCETLKSLALWCIMSVHSDAQ